MNTITPGSPPVLVEVAACQEDDIGGDIILGGCYTDEMNFIPSTLNYSYANWPRKTTLEKPDNYCLMFRSPDAERMFRRLWSDSDFKVIMWLTEEQDENSNNGDLFWGLLPFGDEDVNVLDEGNPLFPIATRYNRVEMVKGDLMLGTFECISQPMKAMFTQRQLEALRIRITHRLFRKCASAISEYWRTSILEQVAEDYKQGEYWYDMIDVFMILADTAVHLRSPMWGYRLAIVPLVLATKGKFKLAHKIVEDLLAIKTNPEKFPTFPPLDNIGERTLRIQLGESHRFLGDWDSSLRVYVEAMNWECHRNGGEGIFWDLRDDDTTSNEVLEYFLSMLQYFAGDGIEEANLYWILLVGLLSKAGYKFGDIACPEEVPYVLELCEQLILPSIQGQPEAIQCLRMVFKSQCVEDFHANLIGCQGASHVEIQASHALAAMNLQGRKDHWKCTSRNDKLPRLWDHTKTSKPSPSFCDNPSCQKQNLRHSELHDCSECHNVQYCSKQCQIQHWPAHKRECRKWCKERQKRNQGNRNRS